MGAGVGKWWQRRLVPGLPGYLLPSPAGRSYGWQSLNGCLSQELLALRLALEEGCGPGPGPPRELSFTKSSQVVRALRDILVSACASQWEQLRGLGSDEDELQKLGSEGRCPFKMTHTHRERYPLHPSSGVQPGTEEGKCLALGEGTLNLPGTEATHLGRQKGFFLLTHHQGLTYKEARVGKLKQHPCMRTRSHLGVSVTKQLEALGGRVEGITTMGGGGHYLG